MIILFVLLLYVVLVARMLTVHCHPSPMFRYQWNGLHHDEPSFPPNQWLNQTITSSHQQALMGSALGYKMTLITNDLTVIKYMVDVMEYNNITISLRFNRV